MSWMFNPPPGWPVHPAGWVPPPGWTPDPNWPAPPAGWQFWIPVNPPTPPFGYPQPPPHQPPAGAPGGPGSPGPGFPGTGFPSGPGGSGSPGPAPAARPWYGRWWAVVGLVIALVVGGLLGFAGTSAGLDRAVPANPVELADPPSTSSPQSAERYPR